MDLYMMEKFDVDIAFSKINETMFSSLNLDDILDIRDGESFSTKWMELYNEIENVKKEKPYTDAQKALVHDYRKSVFMLVLKLTGGHEVATYISDDFGLMLDVELLSHRPEFYYVLKLVYEGGKIPHDKVEL